MDNKQAAQYREGGWGWVIVFAVFFSQFIIYGTIKSLGILLTAMAYEFETDLWIIGSINSLYLAVQMFLAPLAPALGRKFGLRKVLIIGSVIYGLGVILASQSKNVYVLATSLVLISGSGGGLVVESLKGVLVFYFRAKFAVANLIVMAGDPLGMMVYGPFSQVLLETYGWRGTMLLLGGVCCHQIPCCCLLRDTEEESSCPEIQPGTIDVSSAGSEDNEQRKCLLVWKLLKHFALFVNLDIFANVEFVFLAISRTLVAIVFTGIVVYMVPNALSIGLSPSEASFLTIAWGIGNIVGYGLPGVLIYVELLSVHATAGLALLTVVCFAVNQFLSSFVGLMLNMTLMGAGVCCVFQVVAILTREISSDDDHLMSAFCWQGSLSGVGAAVGGVISGWLYDVTGDFSMVFYWLGGVMVTAVLFVFFDLIYKKRRKKRRNTRI